jgi:nicotinamide riboside transporter PnuC
MIDWAIVGWAATAVTLAGTFLNARQDVRGFYVWGLANLVWMVYGVSTNQVFLSIVYVVNTVFCYYGVQCWRKKARQQPVD